jgi:hypothetical protein
MQTTSQPANQPSCSSWRETKRTDHDTYSFQHATGASIRDKCGTENSGRARGSCGHNKRRKIDRACESWGGAVKYQRPAFALHHTWMAYEALALCMRQPEHHQRQNRAAAAPLGVLYRLSCLVLYIITFKAKDTTHQYGGLYYHPVCGSSQPLALHMLPRH